MPMPRTSHQNDIPALKALWKTVFGDRESIIEAFFEHYYNPEFTIVQDCDGQLASACYLLPVGDFVLCDGNSFQCAMIYSVATLPSFRGRGFGGDIVKYAVEHAQSLGYPAIVLCPSDDGLFAYYEKNTGFTDGFFADEAIISINDIPEDGSVIINPITPNEYRAAREKFLAGIPHIAMNERGISYQHHLSLESGGGLFAIISGRKAIGCAAVEVADGDVCIKELLLDDEYSAMDVLSAVAAQVPAKNYTVRTPAGRRGSLGAKTRRFGMIADISVKQGIAASAGDAWFGFAFD